MTRAEAIEMITNVLPAFDERQVSRLAEVARSMAGRPAALELSPEDLAGIERAREDFKGGRTLSSSEARTMAAGLAVRTADVIR